MTEADPFEALREPGTPVDPDPYFAEVLRMRLTRQVFASPGGTMSQQTVATQVEREPAWPPTLTPYIVVSDARRALDWYVEVFGAQHRGAFHGAVRCRSSTLPTNTRTMSVGAGSIVSGRMESTALRGTM